MKKFKAIRAKAKNRGLHFFFYIASMVSLVAIGISGFIKVTMDLYQQDLALANKLNTTETISRLPLTGSPDNQFLLMVTILSFAIVATLFLMLKLNRLNLQKPSKKNKTVKKKVNFKFDIPLLLLGSLLIVLITTTLSLLTSYYRDLYSLDVYSQNLLAAQPISLEDSERFPGATEEVLIKAAPLTEQDIVAVVRLNFDNAEVLNVEPIQALTFGACEDGALYTQNSICADIATSAYFEQGDPLLKATIKWGNEGQSLITAAAENGYFDGFNLNNDMLNMAVDINGQLPITGDDEKQQLNNDQSLAVFLVIAGGFLVVLVILILVARTHPLFNRVPVYYSIFTILVLAVVTLYIGQGLKDKELETTVAAPIEVSVDDWFVCRNEYQKACDWISNATQYCSAELEDIADEKGIDFEMPAMAVKCDGDVAKCKFCAPCGSNPLHLWVLCPGSPLDSLCYGDPAGKIECYEGYAATCDGSGKASSVVDCQPSICTTGYGCGVAPVTPSVSSDPTPTPDTGSVLGTLKSTLPTSVVDQQPFKINFTLKINHEWIRDQIVDICGRDLDYENRCTNFWNWILVETKNGTIEASEYYNGSSWQAQPSTYIFPATYGTNKMILYPAFSYNKEMAYTIKPNKTTSGNLEVTIKLLVGDMNDIMSLEAAYNSSAERANILAPIFIPFVGETIAPSPSFTNTPNPSSGATATPRPTTSSGATATPRPTTSSGATATPRPTTTTSPNPTVSPTLGTYQCGEKGCTNDNQCETGLPDYECDESTTDYPNNNICVRVCPAGTTKTGPCNCSSDTEVVQCGPIDVNGDNILNYIDLAPFSRIYNKSCGDSPFTGGGCGGKDTNGDAKVNYIDLGFFSSHYYPKAQSCLP